MGGLPTKANVLSKNILINSINLSQSIFITEKKRKQSGKIADKLEEPIEALKGLVVIDKLDAVGEDAAEHLKEVNHQVRGHFFYQIEHF